MFRHFSDRFGKNTLMFKGKLMTDTNLHIGRRIAELCKQRLGSEFRITMSKTEPLQWKVFVDGYLHRAGGFVFDQTWFRIDSYCHYSRGWTVPTEYRERVNKVVVEAIREVTRGARVAA
jgi:hypothetical protein